jgi:surface antigen
MNEWKRVEKANKDPTDKIQRLEKHIATVQDTVDPTELVRLKQELVKLNALSYVVDSIREDKTLKAAQSGCRHRRCMKCGNLFDARCGNPFMNNEQCLRRQCFLQGFDVPGYTGWKSDDVGEWYAEKDFAELISILAKNIEIGDTVTYQRFDHHTMPNKCKVIAIEKDDETSEIIGLEVEHKINLHIAQGLKAKAMSKETKQGEKILEDDDTANALEASIKAEGLPKAKDVIYFEDVLDGKVIFGAPLKRNRRKNLPRFSKAIQECREYMEMELTKEAEEAPEQEPHDGSNNDQGSTCTMYDQRQYHS